MHMDPKIKIALILIAFAIIVYWIVNSYEKPMTPAEHYSAAFDPKFIDPRTGTASYSKNIGFRPDEDQMSVDSNEKIFDHVDDQALGVFQYRDIPKKQVRFSEPSVRYEENSLPPVRDVNYVTSYQETDIDVDRVNESNNIHNYCVHGNDKRISGRCGEINDVDSEFVDQVKGSLSMDLSDDQYAGMMNPRSLPKTYIQVQEDEALGAGEYDDTGSRPYQDIRGLEAITEVMNLYRDNTLDTIRGDYRGVKTVCNGGAMLYDSVN